MSIFDNLFGPPNVAKLKAKKDVDGLLKALNYPKDPNVRRAAAISLAQIKNQAVVKPLIAMLNNPDREIRRIAAPALSQMVESQAWVGFVGLIKEADYTPVVAALKDPEASVRKAAVQLLGLRINEHTPGLLIPLLKDPDEAVRQAAILELSATSNEKSLAPLINALKNPEPAVQQGAAQALGEKGDPRALGALAMALKAPDPTVRHAAALALGKLGKVGETNPLVVQLEDADATVQKTAVEQLSTNLVKSLAASLSDSNWQIRRTRAQMLVDLYQAGGLPEAACQYILERRATISQDHQDTNKHKDGPHWDETISGSYSDCSTGGFSHHTDRIATRPGETYRRMINKTIHTDSGIGVKF